MKPQMFLIPQYRQRFPPSKRILKAPSFFQLVSLTLFMTATNWPSVFFFFFLAALREKFLRKHSLGNMCEICSGKNLNHFRNRGVND